MFYLLRSTMLPLVLFLLFSSGAIAGTQDYDDCRDLAGIKDETDGPFKPYDLRLLSYGQLDHTMQACTRALAAEPSSAVLKFRLARMQLATGNSAAAFATVKPSADAGYAPAMDLLASMYYSGIGTSKDLQTAALWYEKAANDGFGNSEAVIGYMYMSGLGVPEDYVKGIAWSQKASDKNISQADETIGSAYALGRGVPMDEERAKEFYVKAANHGSCHAMFVLGGLWAAHMERGPIYRSNAQSYFERMQRCNPADPTEVENARQAWVSIENSRRVQVTPEAILGTIVLLSAAAALAGNNPSALQSQQDRLPLCDTINETPYGEARTGSRFDGRPCAQPY